MDTLVGNNQHGFRRAHSTDTALCEMVSIVTDGLDKEKKVGIYSADLTAAFDLLRMKVLVEKSKRLRLPLYPDPVSEILGQDTSKAVFWVQCFLTYTRQI